MSLTEEETNEKEAVKNSIFLMMIGLIFYFVGFIHDINTNTLSEFTESVKFSSSLLQVFFKLETL